jgi:hypothetical protein
MALARKNQEEKKNEIYRKKKIINRVFRGGAGSRVFAHPYANLWPCLKRTRTEQNSGPPLFTFLFLFFYIFQ